MIGAGGGETADLRLEVFLDDGGSAGKYSLIPRWEPRPPKPGLVAVTSWDGYASLPEGEFVPPVGSLVLTVVKGGDRSTSIRLVPCESEQESDKLESPGANSYLNVEINPEDGLATVRFYEIGQGLHWRSTGVYFMNLIVTEKSDYAYSSVEELFRNTVHFHGKDCIDISFPPLRLNFKKDFRSEGIIGSGAEGTVYKCVSQFSPHHCAVKETRPQTFFVQYTGSEPGDVKILSMLNHENIAELFLAWSEQKKEGIYGTGAIFMSMKLYPRSLRQYLNERRGFNLETRQCIFKQLMEGIAFMHQKCVVHRDVKPGNILVGEDSKVKIVDFGVAKIKQPPHYVGFSGGCYGSIPYSAPEIMNVYKQHDEKADIFSAGIVYYYLFVPQVDGRKDKVTQLSTSIREQIQEFDNQGKDFDLDIVLDGTNVLTDWRGSLPLLKRMTKPKANERPSASEILDLMQLHGIGSENFGFLLR